MHSFNQHTAVVTVPRLVTTEPIRPNRSLLTGNREQIDAFADEMLRRERQQAADIQAETITEGRSYPSRPNRHDD